MRGYWNMADETARVLSADGWLRTGDIWTEGTQKVSCSEMGDAVVKAL